MIFEIRPVKDIGKESFYLYDHYLGKDKSRNMFICSADKLYRTEVVLDGKIITGSWLKQVQLVKRKKAHIIYRLTERGESLLRTIFDTYGDFDFALIEEIEGRSKLFNCITISDISNDMLLSLGTTTSVVLKNRGLNANFWTNNQSQR